jgi:hypothetical protein
MLLPRLAPLFVGFLILSACSTPSDDGGDSGASSNTGSSAAPAPERSESSAPAPERSESSSSEPEAEDKLTVQNNSDFAALLAGPEDGPGVAAFSEKYRVKTIMFDAHVAEIREARRRFDFVIRTGDSGASSPTGPRFKITVYESFVESELPKDLMVGENIRVTALVGEFGSGSPLFPLVTEAPNSIIRR